MNWIRRLIFSLFWHPIKTAPKGRKVLVQYAPHGRIITTCAKYYPPNTLEAGDDWDGDDEYAPEGWYEEAFENENLMMLTVEPTRWMALPR